MSWGKISLMAVVCSLLLVSMVSVTGTASTAHHVYPGDSIQAAVSAASDGDTILVHKGEYHQSVKIETNNITLKGERGTILDGTPPPDPGTTFLWVEAEPGDAKMGIWVASDVSGVMVEGFEIRDYGIVPYTDWGGGIWMEKDSHHNFVIDNQLTGGNFFGIIASTSNHNLIEGNKISENYAGITLERESNDNEVLDNQVKNCMGGIGLDERSSDNLIWGNTVSKSDIAGISIRGIEESELWISRDNWIIENSVTGSGQYGIVLEQYSSHNLIKGNRVSGSGTYDLYELNLMYTDNIWKDNKYRTFGIE